MGRAWIQATDSFLPAAWIQAPDSFLTAAWIQAPDSFLTAAWIQAPDSFLTAAWIQAPDSFLTAAWIQAPDSFLTAAWICAWEVGSVADFRRELKATFTSKLSQDFCLEDSESDGGGLLWPWLQTSRPASNEG